MNYSALVIKPTKQKPLGLYHSPACDTASLCSLKPCSAAAPPPRAGNSAELWLIQKSWSLVVCGMPAVPQAQTASGGGGCPGAFALRRHRTLAGQRGGSPRPRFFANAALLRHSPNSQSSVQESRKWPEGPIAPGRSLGALLAREGKSRRGAGTGGQDQPAEQRGFGKSLREGAQPCQAGWRPSSGP